MLPNLIVIGAMKCGTTSLHYYLGLHPEIEMSNPKELNFFTANQNWTRGFAWYESHFIDDRARIHGESSTNYTKHPFFGGVPLRMHSLLPEAKLIYIVRDPIDRIISMYVHERLKRREDRSIYRALCDLRNNHYVDLSKYQMQLDRYLSHYSRERILVLALEDLARNRPEVLRQTFEFLDVDGSFYCEEYSHVLHKSAGKRRKNWIGVSLSQFPLTNRIARRLPPRVAAAYRLLTEPRVKRPELNEQTRQRLINHLQEDVDRLRRYTGNDFEHWCL